MLQTETLTVKRLRGATIVKIILLGNVLGWSLLTTVAGLFAMFGAEIIQWNNHYVTGLSGFLSSPFIGMFIGLVFGLFTAFFSYIGLRMLSVFRPLTIEYVPSGQPTEAPPDGEPSPGGR